MSISAPDWVRLNSLLDEALDLEPSQRAKWMDSLPAEYAALRETLRDLLLRDNGLETSEVLRRAPSFAAAEIPDIVAGDVVGAYRVIRQIGTGGMATVWLAELADGTLQRQVALKLPRASLLDRDLADRLIRERNILASLEHPCIARLYDAGIDRAGRPYMAMEYVDGIPLDRFVANSQLTIPRRLALFLQVARAVAYAHTHLVVHRDLKPANALVRSDGEVRLLDFGIAQILLPDALAEEQQMHGSIRALTPCYAAPEQFEGQQATVATDVYSLGVMLYELLTGRSPYPDGKYGTGASRGGIVCLEITPLDQLVDHRLQRTLQGDLESILKRALQQRPTDRYATVAALIDDIQRYRQQLPVLARDGSATYRAKKFVLRNRAAVAFSGILMAAIVAGSVASLWQARIAFRERDRALRLVEQSAAIGQFWDLVFTEGVDNVASISMPQLLARSEQMAEKAFANAPLQYSIAVDALSALYISYGFSDQAIVLLERALARPAALEKGNHLSGTLRCKYAGAIGAKGRVAEAEAILSEVISQSEDEPDLKQYCLHRRSIVARDNNDAANALKYIEEAHALWLASPATSEAESALLLGELAYAHALGGNSNLAYQYYDESWALFRKLGREDSHTALTVLNNWGILDISTGNPARALRRYDQAMAIAVKGSPTGDAPMYLLGNRAGALSALARFEEAIRDYDRVIARAEKESNPRVVTYALTGAADIYLKLGDDREAQQILDRSRADMDQLSQDRGPAAIRFRLVEAKLAMRQGRLDEANVILDAVIKQLEAASGKAGGLAMPYIARAEVLLERGQVDAALRDTTRAVRITMDARLIGGYSIAIGLASIAHGSALLRHGDRAAAVLSLRTAVANLENTVDASHPDLLTAQKLLLEATTAI